MTMALVGRFQEAQGREREVASRLWGVHRVGGSMRYNCTGNQRNGDKISTNKNNPTDSG